VILLAKQKTPQQLKFASASAKVRKEGIKPFTKAFGKRMKQLLQKGGSSIKKRSKKNKSPAKSKPRGSSSNRSKGSKGSNKMAGKGKSGTKGMTRLKKFLIGLGIGVGVSTIASVSRIREVEFIGPLADSATGGGVEGQLGVAIPKIIRALVNRSGFSFNGNGSNGLALEGA